MYSERFRQLVAELPNRGDLPKATHVGSASNPVCGDQSQLFLRVEGMRVEAARFRASGCAAAIACSSAVTLLVAGRTLDECRRLTPEDIVSFLEGLPRHKKHAAEVAVDALRSALLSA